MQVPGLKCRQIFAAQVPAHNIAIDGTLSLASVANHSGERKRTEVVARRAKIKFLAVSWIRDDPDNLATASIIFLAYSSLRRSSLSSAEENHHGSLRRCWSGDVHASPYPISLFIAVAPADRSRSLSFLLVTEQRLADR